MGFPYVPSTAMIGLTPAKMTILALKTGLRILTSPLVSTAVQQRQSVSNLARFILMGKDCAIKCGENRLRMKRATTAW